MKAQVQNARSADLDMKQRIYTTDINIYNWIIQGIEEYSLYNPSGRRVGPFPREQAQDQGSWPCYCNTEINEVVSTREYIEKDGKLFGQVPSYKVCSEISLTDLPKRGMLPPLKNKLQSWCCDPSTTTPYNTALHSAEIMLWLKEDAWPEAWMWKNEVQCSSKRPLKEGEGIPKQECLVLNSIAISTKQLEKEQ